MKMLVGGLMAALVCVGAPSAVAHPHGPGNGGARAAAPLDLAGPFDIVIGSLDGDSAWESNGNSDGAMDYARDLVALDAVGAEYTISRSETPHDVSEAIHALSEGHHDLNLLIAPPREDLTNALAPIYFPVYRGLMGHRMLVVNGGDANGLADLDALSDLRDRVAAVRADSGDADLFRHNGIEVVEGPGDGVIAAVANGRVDYAVLPIGEAFSLLDGHENADFGLVVQPDVVLAFEGDAILYASGDDRALIAAIDRGLMSIYSDGSFLEFFETHDYIVGETSRARLNERRYILMTHPDMPRHLLRTPQALWLHRETGARPTR